jgi:hypothetical protein
MPAFIVSAVAEGSLKQLTVLSMMTNALTGYGIAHYQS